MPVPLYKHSLAFGVRAACPIRPDHRARILLVLLTHHGCSSVANQGWLGRQLVFLHDARGGDSQGKQI